MHSDHEGAELISGGLLRDGVLEQLEGAPVPVLGVCLLGPRHSGVHSHMARLPAEVALTRIMAERYSFPGRPPVVRSDLAAATRVAATGRVLELRMPDELDRLAPAAASLWDAVRDVVG